MTVDEFVKTKVLPEYRDVVAEVRKMMREYAPDAEELMAYGIPCYKRKRYIAVISPNKKGVTVSFTRGAQFEDRYGLLGGAGKSSKRVMLRDLGEVNKPALRYYIKQALALDDR